MTQEPDTSKTRVLIIDNDETVRTDLCEILEMQGYQVRAPAGAGEQLIEAAVQALRAFRPHVAVVDLRLADDYVDRTDGLTLMKRLKPAECVIYSAHASFEVTRAVLLERDAADIVRKNEDVDRLLRAIDKAAQKVCACQSGIELTSRSGADWVGQIVRQLPRLDQAVSDQEAPGIQNLPGDLLAILFPGEKKLILHPEESGPAAAHPVARGRTVVMKVQRGDRLEVDLVKFAPADKIRREAGNYHEYIEDNLGGHFRATLKKSAEFYELGGAVYTFLGYPGRGEEAKPMRTLAEAYLGSSQAPFERLLDHFFKTVWNGLYQKRDTRAVTPYAAYAEILKLDAKLERANSAHGLTINVPGLALDLPNAFNWLRENGPRLVWPEPLRYAITHGDLHAGNLLVDDALLHTWTIDFERTGFGPVLRDFVELEVDIATRLVDDKNETPTDFWALAQALCLPVELEPGALAPGMRRGCDLIQHLRQLAESVTGGYDPREYLWGVLCDAAFVALTEPPGTMRYDRAVMLAGAACEALEGAMTS